MKKIYLILIILCWINQHLKAQNKPLKNQFLLFEVGGANVFYSLNFEKINHTFKNWKSYNRIGASVINSKNFGINLSRQFIQNKNKKWNKQFGIGIAYNNNKRLDSSISIQGLIGIRRTIKNNYIIIAINPSLNYFYNDKEFPISTQFLYPSIGFGYNITNK